MVLVLGVAGVAGDGERRLGAAEPGDRLLERLDLAGGDDDARALGDEPVRDGEADAAAGAGDDGDLAVETSRVPALTGRGPGR